MTRMPRTRRTRPRRRPRTRRTKTRRARNNRLPTKKNHCQPSPGNVPGSTGCIMGRRSVSIETRESRLELPESLLLTVLLLLLLLLLVLWLATLILLSQSRHVSLSSSPTCLEEIIALRGRLKGRPPMQREENQTTTKTMTVPASEIQQKAKSNFMKRNSAPSSYW